MASLNLIKCAVGLESTAGTVVPRAYRLQITGNPGLDSAISRERDPAISGENMATGFYTTRILNGGPVPISWRPSPGCILAAYSALGGTTPVSNGTQIGACIRIRYTGSSPSCKISANTSGDTLSAAIGTYGAEVADSNFGDYGDIDLTDGSTNTVGKLVTVIHAYDDYEAEKVFGADAVDAADIIDITAAQAKNGWAYVWFSSTTSGAYRYKLAAHIGTTERPTLSVQIDERSANEVYGGCVVDQLAIEAALQGFVSATATMQAFAEYADHTVTGDITSGDATVKNVDTRNLIPAMTVTGSGIQDSTTISSITTVAEFGELELSKTASATTAGVTLTVAVPDNATTLPSIDPLVFWKGSFSLGADEYTYVNNIALTFANNGREDTFGQGSAARQYNLKGIFDVSGTFTVPLDSTSYANRSKIGAGTQVALSFYFKGKTIGAGVPEFMLIDLPYCELTSMSRPENGGQLDAEFGFQAIAPKGGYHGDPVTMYLVSSVNMT